MDFGPVVKTLDITVKKAEWKMVETSDVVSSLATREYREGWGRAREPGEPLKGAKKIEKLLKILRLQIF